MAALAELDGSHEVIFEDTGDATALVLHHSHGDAAELCRPDRSVVHQHGLMMRMMVLLSQPVDRDPDHVLPCSVTLVGDPAGGQRTVSRAESSDAGSVLFVALAGSRLSPPLPPLWSGSDPPSISRSDQQHHLLGLRSTVITI